MSIKVMRSGYERGKYKPVQAYIDRGVLTRFIALYPSHGDITKLIRNAFVIAINEDEQTETAAKHAVETQLPDAPPTETIELPCEECIYPRSCVRDSQCAVNELERQIEASRHFTKEGRPLGQRDTLDYDTWADDGGMQGLDNADESG